tara:strand:- start:3911 stop:4198 length:288 start_codon:yes stop_codon:yes gene_type:complete
MDRNSPYFGMILNHLCSRRMNMEMTMMEKLRYAPKEGDVLIYLDGSHLQIEEIKKTHVKLVKSGSDEGLPLKPVAHIRTDLIRNECFLCRKTDKK